MNGQHGVIEQGNGFVIRDRASGLQGLYNADGTPVHGNTLRLSASAVRRIIEGC